MVYCYWTRKYPENLPKKNLEVRSQESGVRMNSVQLVDESGFKAPRFIREEKKKFSRGVTPDYV
ncbi:hypothetical protein [Sphaerospermopsis sp. FACHB-1194]|uniref:hypothetical protein n=1 Tax=Sphaerospermopsis sp. FACHB-1194 TaxID=2692862 RepID=UPI00168066FD|nr:hypothetical protein [Sphaerospermopsis sp. FACHB-1194]MBD2145748.1 hypothetical protein [Sphaerospermopsis sp. FACHB-1194]